MCFFIVMIISVIMLALSFSVITPHQYGIHYRKPVYTLDLSVWDNGRHFLGLGHTFFKFPRKYEYIEYSNSQEGGSENKPITCWTNNGQELIIEVGFYYQLKKDKLLDLFFVYKEDYLPTLEKVARHAIRDVTTTFQTLQFFEQRGQIQDAMAKEVNKRVSEYCFANVPLLNILTIDVPDGFERSVIEKIMVAQEVHTLTMRKKTEEIRANIKVVNEQAAADITVINADAYAKGRIIEARAEAKAQRSVLENEVRLYNDLGQGLGLTCKAHNVTQPTGQQCGAVTAPKDSVALLQYLWINTYKAKAAKMIVGMDL
jgi:regulator of protease activity HflC (stomatin/prohibitin superfamily)